jgi:hypothetical protein
MFSLEAIVLTCGCHKIAFLTARLGSDEKKKKKRKIDTKQRQRTIHCTYEIILKIRRVKNVFLLKKKRVSERERQSLKHVFRYFGNRAMKLLMCDDDDEDQRLIA